jgi:hypothetical protein
MNHQEEEAFIESQTVAEETNPGACFPDCELEDLQSTAGIIPIPLIVNVLGAEDILSDEAKQETALTYIDDIIPQHKLNDQLVTEAEIEDQV